MVNLVKLYHWKTKEYLVHKATEELKERLEYNVDRLVEILLGKCGSRLSGIQHRVRLIDIKNTEITFFHYIFKNTIGIG